ncbi:MAG TPA: hypothetical protein VL134_03415 [Leptolyngbya sp.]|jgi:hypothetical protein|nr:hypothetical protein [Leptolyngbya sp.]
MFGGFKQIFPQLAEVYLTVIDAVVFLVRVYYGLHQNEDDVDQQRQD